MKVHLGWYEEARKQTLETLPTFLNHLMNDYQHDYGTICHALAAGGIATMWAMNNDPKGGITGFQGGAVMWEVIRYWNYEHNKCGLKLVDYDNMLYPQYDHNFANTISPGTWKELQKEAKVLLKGKGAHPDVRKHWQEIVEGTVPFRYSIKED